MRVRYGVIEIANNQPFSQHLNGFSISPWLQDLFLQISQSCPLEQAATLARNLLNQSVNTNQLHRMVHCYGQLLEDAFLTELSVCQLLSPLGESVDIRPIWGATPVESVPAMVLSAPTPLPIEPVSVVRKVSYFQADGSVIFTDGGWKEVKLGRVFEAEDLIKSGVAGRGGRLAESIYGAQLGDVKAFQAVFSPLFIPFDTPEWTQVFVSDGAIWIRHMMEKYHPTVHLILDYYHAMDYVSKAALGGITNSKRRKNWLDVQATLLKDSQLDQVIANIKRLSIEASLSKSVITYLDSNRDRMDYKTYLSNGWLIGSGAVEAAHQTVIQCRMKLSGQRWSHWGAVRMLALRVWWENGWWDRVREYIEPSPAEYAMAA